MTARPLLAPLLQSRRRALDLSVEEVARASGTTVADVVAAEGGGDLPPPLLGPLCEVLGLDATALLPDVAHGPVAAPVPLDVAHARSLATLATHVQKGGGWLVCPDPSAWVEAHGDPRPVLRALADGLARSRARDLWAYRAVAALGSASLAASLAGLLPVGPLLTACCALVPPVAVAVAHVTRTRPRRHRLRRLDASARECDRMCRTAFLIGASGLEVLSLAEPTVGMAGLSPADGVRTVSADRIYATEAREVGPGHVTVTLQTLDGAVVMPWVARSRVLADVLAAWAAPRAGAPWRTVATAGVAHEPFDHDLPPRDRIG